MENYGVDDQSKAAKQRAHRRAYMQQYRQQLRDNDPNRLEDILAKGREYARERQKIKRATDPDWVEQERSRGRAYMQKHRADPENRKKSYAAHKEWAQKNKHYLNEKNRERNQKPEYKLKARERLLNKNYGMSSEDFQRLFDEQEGSCAICRKTLRIEKMGKDRAVVDHDHSTGKVRGILCSPCNLSLGILEPFAESLILYLKGPSKLIQQFA